MTQTLTAHAPHLAFLSAQTTLSPVALIALRTAVLVQTWVIRHRTRKSLVDLDDHLLKDIGIDRHTALIEAKRRFWQG